MTPRRLIKILRRHKYDDSIGVIRTNQDRRIIRITFCRGNGALPAMEVYSIIQGTFPAPAWIEVHLDPSEHMVGAFRKFVYTPAYFLRWAAGKDIKVWDRYKVKFAQIVMMAKLEGAEGL